MLKNKGLALRIGIVVVILIMTYVVAAELVPRAMVTFTKAAPASIISLKDSRILGQRILAKADGEDKCVINVYIMDKNGKGVSNKPVELVGVEGISPPEGVTDAQGKASFEVVSQVEGQFELTASVGGSPLPNGIKVTFRK